MSAARESKDAIGANRRDSYGLSLAEEEKSYATSDQQIEDITTGDGQPSQATANQNWVSRSWKYHKRRWFCCAALLIIICAVAFPLV